MIDDKICRSCKNRWAPEDQSSCWFCDDNDFYESDEIVKTTRRITNYEKIKNMSVDEMAKFLMYDIHDVQMLVRSGDLCYGLLCSECCCEWLLSESEVDA